MAKILKQIEVVITEKNCIILRSRWVIFGFPWPIHVVQIFSILARFAWKLRHLFGRWQILRGLRIVQHWTILARKISTNITNSTSLNIVTPVPLGRHKVAENIHHVARTRETLWVQPQLHKQLGDFKARQQFQGTVDMELG
jgi:hypothetical protein